MSLRLHANLHASRDFGVFESVLSSYPPPPSSSLDGIDEPEEGFLDPSAGQRFVQEMKAGDRVAVLALAQYPMWVNSVRGVRVRMEVAAV